MPKDSNPQTPAQLMLDAMQSAGLKPEPFPEPELTKARVTTEKVHFAAFPVMYLPHLHLLTRHDLSVLLALLHLRRTQATHCTTGERQVNQVLGTSSRRQTRESLIRLAELRFIMRQRVVPGQTPNYLFTDPETNHFYPFERTRHGSFRLTSPRRSP